MGALAMLTFHARFAVARRAAVAAAVFCAFLAAFWGAAAAAAETSPDIRSRYSDIGAEACFLFLKEPGGESRVCPGRAAF